jgi:hypothetical protein
MTFPETLNTKFSFNELSFLLVTPMVNSDTRFGSYGVLKSRQGAEQILVRLGMHVNHQVLMTEDV